LFIAARYPIDQKQEQQDSDIHSSIDIIQRALDPSDINHKTFTIKSVEQQLANYQHYSQTEEGKDSVLNGFEKKAKEG